MMKESPISQTDTKTDFLLQKKKDHRNQIQSYEIETSPHIPNPTPESRHFNHERIAHIADKNEEKETREREREKDSLFGIHLARSRPPQTGSVFWSYTPLTTDHDLEEDHRTPSKFCSSFSSPPADHG
jgi:hypothetical protein